MALQIFHHHVPDSHMYDPSNSGAEWWVQIRPSPAKTGRYSLVREMDKLEAAQQNKESSTGESGCDDDLPTGISFHWDKDEELRLMTGGSLYIHPHISTVTYLTNIGAPTMVLDCMVDPASGSDGLPDLNKPVKGGFISWPRTGKHLSFDGRMLHAAPIDLMEEGEFERQCEIKNTTTKTSQNDLIEENEKKKKKESRQKRRVTFLVNIWLNYRPFGVNPFPQTMIDKLSSVESVGDLFPKSKDNVPGSDQNDVKYHSPVTVAEVNVKNQSQTTESFTWPLGGNNSQEKIKVQIPLSIIRSKMKEGGNINIQWNEDASEMNSKNGVLVIKDDTTENDNVSNKQEDIDSSDTPTKRQKIA